MIYSMTGFGRDEKLINNYNIIVEIRALNSKSLDMNLKIDDSLSFVYDYIRKSINQKINRGKVDVSITINNSSNRLIIPFDKLKIKKYLKELKKDFEVNESDIISNLFTNYKLLSSDINISKNEKKKVKEVIDKSINKLIRYRLKEGKAIEQDLKKSVLKLENYIKKISSFESLRIKEKKNKFQNYFKELKNEYDKSRLEQEIIYYIEKFDINEEIMRLKNHLKFFNSEINSRYANGKKLSFISQEIGREINTIGSKANYFKIQSLVVNMKEENEKIKKNIFNIL